MGESQMAQHATEPWKAGRYQILGRCAGLPLPTPSFLPAGAGQVEQAAEGAVAPQDWLKRPEGFTSTGPGI